MKAELLIKAVVQLHEENFSSPEECIETAIKLFGPDTQVVERAEKGPRKTIREKLQEGVWGGPKMLTPGKYEGCNIDSLLSPAMRTEVIKYIRKEWKNLHEEDRKHLKEKLKNKGE